MLPEHRRFLNHVRRQMLTQLSARDSDTSGYLVRATILLTPQILGPEPRWTPSAKHAELIGGELWAAPTADPDVFDVVAYPHVRGRDPQVITSAQVRCADLLGALGVYEDPERLAEFAIDGAHVTTTLATDHPARRYHVFIEGMWDNLVQLCSWNGGWEDSVPPMPAVNRQDSGDWVITFLLTLCEHGIWDDADEDNVAFLCGMFDSYPGAQWRISPAPQEQRCRVPREVWQRLGLEPRDLVATPRTTAMAAAPSTYPWGEPAGGRGR